MYLQIKFDCIWKYVQNVFANLFAPVTASLLSGNGNKSKY